MILALPYPPSANAYWRTVKNRTYVTHEARRYKGTVAKLCEAVGTRPIDGPVRVTVSVYRPRKSGDLDNTLKVLLDALKGCAFVDDSQVVHLEARRMDDAANPRAVVQVEGAP